MILTMNKYAFMVFHKDYADFLDRIRQLGVVHIREIRPAIEDAALQTIMAERKRINVMMRFLANINKNASAPLQLNPARRITEEEGLRWLASLEALQEQKAKLLAKSAAEEKDLDHLSVWGDFTYPNIRNLLKAGYEVSFFTCPTARFEPQWGVDYNAFLVNNFQSVSYFVTVTKIGEPIDIDAERARMPEHDAPELRDIHAKTLADIRRKEPMPHSSYEGEIAPWQALEAFCEITDHKAIITTEVGQNQMWAAQHCKVEAPRRFLSSGGLGTMGFGFPAAIGAAYACPGQTVCCVAGDGSLMMNIQELDTCARYNIPVKIMLLNNACLGNVRQWQYLFYNCRYSNTIYTRNPDFVALSESMGVPAFSVSSPGELRPAIEKMLAEPGPALLDVRIPQGAMVLPMVYPGDSIDNMVSTL